MLGIDHEHLKRFYTAIAVAIAVTTVSVRIALYDHKMDQILEESAELQSRLAFLESQSKSKSVMDSYQNQQIEKIENVLFVPRPTQTSF